MAFIDLSAELVALYPAPSPAENIIEPSFYVQPLYNYILNLLQTNSKSNELGQIINTIREQNAENIYVKIHLANKGNSKIHRVKCLLDFFLGLLAEYLKDQKLTLEQLKSIHGFIVNKTQQESSPRTTSSSSTNLDSEDAVIEASCDLLKDYFADVATSKKSAKKTQGRRGSSAKVKGLGQNTHDTHDATSPYSSDASPSPFPLASASSATAEESPKKKQKVTHNASPSVSPKVEVPSPVPLGRVKQEPRPESASPPAPAASVSSAPSSSAADIELLEKIDSLLTEKASLQEQVHSLQNKANLVQSQLQQEREVSQQLQERLNMKDRLIQSLKRQDQTSAQKKVELFEVFCQTMKSFISKQSYAADFQGPFQELENKLQSL